MTLGYPGGPKCLCIRSAGPAGDHVGKHLPKLELIDIPVI
jgi:hypothetical protein